MKRALLAAVVLLLTACADPRAAAPDAPPTTATARTTATASPTPIRAHSGPTYVDPFAYCGAAGTVDARDDAYTGDPQPASIGALFYGQRARGPTGLYPAFTWRCFEGRVLACSLIGNGPRCDKPHTDSVPTANIAAYCASNADGPVPYFYAKGERLAWECRGHIAVAVGSPNLIGLDARGFNADEWKVITPP